MELPTNCLYPVQEALEQWTDQRTIDAADAETLLLFVLYGPSILSQSGKRWCGYVCRQKGDQVLLTLKAKENETPLVVFITADTTIGCMSRFFSLFEDDRLKWVRDRYPWN